MSYSLRGHVNRGAYDQPYSGVGIEFDPLGVKPGRTGITLHESGFLPANDDWKFPAVFSPFWRLYYNRQRGHCVLFGERDIELTPQHLLLIPPHCLFHCLGGNPVPSFWLAFSFTQRPIHGVRPQNATTPTPERWGGVAVADHVRRHGDERRTAPWIGSSPPV